MRRARRYAIRGRRTSRHPKLERRGSAAQGTNGGGSGPQQPDRTADYFAKVVKVSGDSIIVQKSTMSPADMPSFGGGRGGGQRPQGGEGEQGQGQGGGRTGGQRGNWQRGNGADGTGGQVQGGQGQAAGGQAGSGQTAAGGQTGGGQAAGGTGTGGQGQVGRQGGRPGGGGGFANQMTFTDEQITVPVNADTQIVKFGRGQNGVTTDAMTAADLQAGDILMVWLGSDNKTAIHQASIQSGNFGNAANADNAGKAGNGQ